MPLTPRPIIVAVLSVISSVISTVIFWLLEDWATAMELLKELPWGQLAAIAWLGFGGCMALVEAWAKRN